MYGYQETYQERWEPGPDGKLTRNVYIVRRELSKEEVEKLSRAHAFEPIFADMFGFLPNSKKPKKPRGMSGPFASFDGMFKAIDKLLGG